MADVGSARVEIVGDVARFARRAERELNAVIRQLKLKPIRLNLDLEHARSQAQFLAEDIQHSFDNVNFDTLQDGAAEAAQGIGDEFSNIDFSRVKEQARAAARDIGIAFEAEGRRSSSTMGDHFRRAGIDAAKFFAGSLTSGLSALPNLIKPSLIVTGLALAGGIAAVAGPALGGLLASAVLAGGGLGVIGLGAFLLREEPEMVRAATSLMDTVKSVFTRAAQPLLEPLVKSLNVFETLVVRIGPQLRGMFADIAPAIVPFAVGLERLVENSLPGFQELIEAANPFLRGLADVLPGLGQSFSNFFGNIAASGPEATIFFQDFINFLGQLIRWLGEAIGWLARAYVAVKDFLGPLPEILREAWAAFREGASVGEIFAILEQAFDPGFFDRVVESIRNLITNGFQFLANNIGSVIETILSARAAVTDAAIQLVTGIADALPEIVPQVVDGALQLVTALVDSLVQTIPKLVEAAGLLVNGLVDGIVAALPGLIQGATQIVTALLTGIITLLPIVIDAGLRLIQGLVEGIMVALPQIQLAAIQIIPQLISGVITLLPQILMLGTNILTALIQGISANLPALIATVQTQVIPTLITALQTQGPVLIQQGAQALVQFMQGWLDSVTIITEVITNQIIPAITTLFQENPEIIEAGIAVILTLLQAFTDNLPVITEFISETFIPAMTTIIEQNLPVFIAAGLKIMLAVQKGIIQAIPQILVAIVSQVIPAMVSALLSASFRLQGVAVQLIAAFVGSLLSAWASRSGAMLNAIKNVIINAFSGAGSWLRDAGRRIIDGLISGIQSGFDRVQSTLSSLTSLLPDWKGPADVDRKILRESGQLVMRGFQLGIEDQRAAIQRSLQGITGDLPTFTGSSAVRGGDGAGTAAVTLTIMPGAIVIQGQGGQVGQEAAEAILERLGQARLVR